MRDLFAAIDGKDTERFTSFLTPDARFRFGSAPPALGVEQITAAVEGFFAAIDGCSHRLVDSWQGDGTVVCEGEVTYRRHDGSEVILPFVNVFGMNGPKIADYKIYIDNGPLFAD